MTRAPAPRTRPAVELAQVVRAYGDAFAHTRAATPARQRVLAHIADCRTAALGGHIDRCQSCDHRRISYNSCRDRHCPKCQQLAKAQWLAERCTRLLPVPHFHVVFTVPAPLRPLALANPRRFFDLLFAAAADTLHTLAADPRHLGARIGFTAVLHTWSQDLSFHPHLHCVVTGGGLAFDRRRWVRGRTGFLFPVRVLAALFRGKLLAALTAERAAGALTMPRQLAADPAWRALCSTLYRTRWVVYAKAPFAGPRQVFDYLGRYTHRIAIANHRLVAVAAGQVSFRVRNRATGRITDRCTLDAVEFLRRFTLHVLPRRFVRIRHYGLLAAASVHRDLARAHRLLSSPAARRRAATVLPPTLPWWRRLLRLTGVDIRRCPACRRGRLLLGPMLSPRALALALVGFDTS